MVTDEYDKQIENIKCSNSSVQRDGALPDHESKIICSESNGIQDPLSKRKGGD